MIESLAIESLVLAFGAESFGLDSSDMSLDFVFEAAVCVDSSEDSRNVIFGNVFDKAARISRVPSLLQSSTMIISLCNGSETLIVARIMSIIVFFSL